MKGTAPHDAPPLLGILSEVARLLEVGEVEGAARLMDAVVQSCGAPDAPRLGPDAVAQARALLGACMAAQTSLRDRLSGEMGRLSASRRATAAYGS